MKYLSLLSIILFSFFFLNISLAENQFLNELSIPLKKENRNLLIWGTALTITTVIFEEQLDYTHDEFVDHKPIGDLSPLGDWSGKLIPNIIYSISQGIIGYNGNEKGYHRATGMLKATAYAAGVTTVLKYTIREPRPDDHSQRNSFPSGHTTTAFAFGGYVLQEHGVGWGIPALGLSTLTALSRINDNRHRTHDVFAGATIGLLYGIGIARQDNSDDEKRTTLTNFAPIYDQYNRGIVWIKNF